MKDNAENPIKSVPEFTEARRDVRLRNNTKEELREKCDEINRQKTGDSRDKSKHN
jgi:hypothetical protein